MSRNTDLNVICRVCLVTGEWISLHSDSETTKKFQFCTKLEITENDELPKGLCNKCVGRLKVAYDFRMQAEQSDKYLRQSKSHFTEYGDTLMVTDDFIKTAKIEMDQIDKIKQLTTDHYLHKNKKENPISQAQNTVSLGADVPEHLNVFLNLSNSQANSSIYVEEESLDIKVEAFDGFTKEADHEKVGQGLENFVYPKSKPDYDTENDNANQADLDTSKLYHCTNCSKKYYTKARLQRHLKTHSGVKPFECTICDIQFTQKVSLKRHMGRHMEEKPYKCETCDASFLQKYYLERHALFVHNIIKEKRQTTEETHECETCHRLFTCKASLAKHLKWFSKQKQSCVEGQLCLSCNTGLTSKKQRCNQAIPTMEHFNDHESCHSGENQQKAEVELILLKENERKRRQRQLKLARETPEEAALRREKQAAQMRRSRAKRANVE